MGQQLLILLVCLATVLPLSAQDKRIGSLIDQLQHTRFSVREQALRQLIEIGEPARKDVQRLTLSGDVDLAGRAGTILRQIEQDRLNRELNKAPLLHLNFEKVPLILAVAEIQKRTGLPFILDEKKVLDSQRLISIDTGNVPMWQAIDQFCEAVGLVQNDFPSPLVATVPNSLTHQSPVVVQGRQALQIGRAYLAVNPSPASPDTRIVLMDGKPEKARVHSGLLRVRATPKESVGNARNRGADTVRMLLDITPPVSAAWLGIVGIDVRRATDANGLELQQTWTGEEGDAGIRFSEEVERQTGIANIDELASMPSGTTYPITLHGKTQATHLKELSGMIFANMRTPETDLLTIEDVTRQQPKSIFRSGDYQVEILKVNKTDKGIEIRIRTVIGPEPEEQEDRIPLPKEVPSVDLKPENQNPAEHIQFRTSEGKVLAGVVAVNLPEGAEEKNPAEVVIYTLPKGIENVSLSLRGSRVVTIQIPFSLKNVVLP